MGIYNSRGHKMKCIVFYHQDNDGKAAAYCIHRNLKKLGYDSAEYIAVDYGMELPLEKINKGTDVWIVDYSVDEDTMLRIFNDCNNVYWIDHHKTAIEKYGEKLKGIPGLRYDGISGCELTWLFIEYKLGYVNNIGNPQANIRYAPYYIRLIGDRDVWKWEYGKDTAWFHLATMAMDLSPLSEDWKEIEQAEKFSDYIDLFDAGRTIERYRDATAKEYRDAYGYEVEWEGYKCFAMNLGHAGAEHFGEKNKEYDILISYVFDGEQCRVSLRTEKDIDASVLAVKQGGGGHSKACGFRCKELPWMK